ncbi:MAG: hypothetical protein QXY92_06330 [Archaeoglobaceae archaeon]
MMFLSLLVSISCLVFIIGVFYRIAKLLDRTHVRCELYPNPFYFHSHRDCGEIKDRKRFFIILRAIASIAILNRKKMSLQPKHWFATFVFHLGIFLHILWIFILGLYVFTGNLIIFEGFFIFSILGFLGLVLMSFFANYLLIRKLRAPIRNYVPMEDYTILFLVILMSSSGILAFFEVDLDHMATVLKALLTQSPLPEIPPLEFLHLLSFSILILILPFTRITHYIAVWFTHLVLWDNRSAERLEPRLSETLKRSRVKWCADHLNPDMSWEEELKWTNFKVGK